jgi:DNA-binding CsgD family transcriptional regulator
VRVSLRVSSPVLIGRDAELAALLRALEACADDERTVALVTGDAGIGKTRLLRELAAVARTGSTLRVVVARGDCLRMADVDVPFAALPAVLDDLDAASPSPDVRRAVAEARQALLAPQVEVPRAAIVAPRPDRAGLVRLRLFERLLDAVRQVLATGADRLLVVLDDVHWADPATLDLIAFLARRVRRSGVLVVIACRAEALLSDGPLRALLLDLERDCVLERVDLAPLTPSEVSRQIRAIEGVGGGGAHDPAAIAARSEGNPFVVEELLRLPADASTVPDSLREILRSRLAQLDGGARGLLDVLSVVGRPASRRELADAIGLASGIRAQAIRAAVEAGILVEADGLIGFRHSLLGEAVLRDLDEALAADLHARVAATIAAGLDANRTPARLLEVASHLDLAGDVGRALPALIAGAEAAKNASAWTAAARAYERAGELAVQGDADSGDALELWHAAAGMWLDASDPARALHVSRRLANLARQLGHRDATLLAWANISSLQNEIGPVDRGYRLARRIARMPPPQDPAAAVLVDLAVGAAIALAGPDLEARDRLRSVRTRAATLGMAAEATSLLSHIAAQHGDAVTTLRLVDEAFAGVPMNPPDAIETILANHAVDASGLGDWTRVRSVVDRMRRSATTYGKDHEPLIRSYLAVSEAELALRTGDLAGCLAAVDAGAGISLRLHPYHTLRGKEANAAALAGDTARALAAVETALRLTRRCWYDRSVLHCGQALAALAEGRLEDARDAIIQAIDIPQASWQPQSDAAHLAVVAVRIAAELGSRAGAHRDAVISWARPSAAHLEGLAEGRARAGDVVPPVNVARGLLGVAEWRRALGIRDAGVWREALVALDAAGLRHEAAHARVQLARVLLANVRGRDEPTSLLAAAAAYARVAPAAPLLREVLDLARAARIAVTEEPAPGARSDESSPSVDPGVTRSGAVTDGSGLSSREREVLALVAEGRSNREIAEALYITPKTASSHVTHILDKLGVSSRVEAALLAARADAFSGASGGRRQASPDGGEAGRS